MKKIVALVLSLVMVLGLATVAFADTKDYTKDEVTIVAKDGTKVDVTDKVVMTTENKVTENGKFKSLVPTYYTYGTDVYTVCDASVATHLLTVAGTQVYAAKMSAPTVTKDGAALYTAPKAKMCDKVGSGEAKYVVVEGKYYAQATDITTASAFALVNGKMVGYVDGTTYDPEVHQMKDNSLKYNVDGDVASFQCSVCEKVISVVKKAPDFATNYAKITLGNAGDYYYVVGSGATAGTAGDKVNSAETFDAGIAMYVGMSVMAAAGSAVVLKKKD